MRAILSWLIFPVTLGGALLATAAGLRAGLDPGPLTTGVLLSAAALILILQRVHPYRGDWRGGAGEIRTDLLHGVISTGGSSLAFQALAFGALISAGGALSARLGAPLWPGDWPLWAQLPLALVVGELGQYSVHRLSHVWSPLWRLHALHHSSEQLYMLSAGRNHPLSNLLSYGANISVLVAVGAPGELLAMQSVFTGVHGFLQHANVAIRTGWLRYVFATADYHRWHHSTVMAEGNTNFGSNLIVLDWLLGTAYLPPEREVGAVGLGDMPNFPRGFWGQLASPFSWRRLQ